MVRKSYNYFSQFFRESPINGFGYESKLENAPPAFYSRGFRSPVRFAWCICNKIPPLTVKFSTKCAKCSAKPHITSSVGHDVENTDIDECGTAAATEKSALRKK